ncbi:DUF6232 family protein [Cohnella sp. GCM10027633]|uniref:DUF6232 family protein n=1 Tax=unclassified Cohnella TaxID=2636738 RepID=UPI00362E96A0
MDHQPIYKDANFTLTKDLFITGGARFAMAHLSSIRLVKTKREIPYTLLVLEVLLIVGGLGWDYPYHGYVALLGFLGLIGSSLNYFLRKPVHKLTVVFASGERESVGSTDYSYLESLANAFSRAMVETRYRNILGQAL